jgi:hypothetical protein
MPKNQTFRPIYVDSFSGSAASLPPSRRTPAGVLAALSKDPRISTFDMSELLWLRGCIDALKRTGRITEDTSEPYPWHKFNVVEAKGGV